MYYYYRLKLSFNFVEINLKNYDSVNINSRR